MNPKQRAGEAALNHVSSNTVIGLGMGSTADFFLQALADALRTGKLQNVCGIPTSQNTERRAKELNIPLTTFAENERAAVTIDGADEIDEQLNLIKGLGGALLREKMLAQNSDRLIIIADASKYVHVLGSKSPLPVEVAPFGWETQLPFLRSLGCQPVLRLGPSGIYKTDNGNFIFDCKFPRIDDPAGME